MYRYNVPVQLGMSGSLESIGRYFNICIYLLTGTSALPFSHSFISIT